MGAAAFAPAVSLPASIPRADPFEAFDADPLAFLAEARRAHGDVVALVEDRPVFSRAERCAGAIAVFGADNQRAVLSSMETFGMPVSVGERYRFPPPLANLNTGLFSMRGEKHRARQQLLVSLLHAWVLDDHHAALRAGCRAFLAGLRPGRPFHLLDEMRRFSLHVSSRLVFGSSPRGAVALGTQIQAYFQGRRAYATFRGAGGDEARAELLALGTAIDGAIRDRLARCLRHGGPPRSLLARLAAQSAAHGLSEDELVAHGNILFTSGSEPVAVALTWTLLVLSQLPSIRRALRRELAGAKTGGRTPGAAALRALPLLDAVVRESLRLLPPNAIMVRLTAAPATLTGHALPAGCEVLLCPFVSHRDPDRFPDPRSFSPGRWAQAKPTAFEYLPFGAGARYCVGQKLAADTLRLGLAVLLGRYDVVLDGDQDVDWIMNVNLMPANDPVMVLRAPAAGAIARGGRLGGPVAGLLDLPAAPSHPQRP